MHSAPAVSYPVGRSHFHAVLLIGVLTVGAGSLIAWIAQSDAVSLRHVTMAVLWLISGWMSWQAWFHSSVGVLTWDGQHWTWVCGDDGRLVDLRVTMDTQHTLLLHLRAPGSPGWWVWLERRTAPMRWLPMRRAVFAPQSGAHGQDDGLVSP